MPGPGESPGRRPADGAGGMYHPTGAVAAGSCRVRIHDTLVTCMLGGMLTPGVTLPAAMIHVVDDKEWHSKATWRDRHRPPSQRPASVDREAILKATSVVLVAMDAARRQALRRQLRDEEFPHGWLCDRVYRRMQDRARTEAAAVEGEGRAGVSCPPPVPLRGHS